MSAPGVEIDRVSFGYGSTKILDDVSLRVEKGELKLQQMDVQTYFFRRKNINAKGEPRSWTDHLLWHHAAHTVDLFRYQAGAPIVKANAVQGPIHPELGIALDMSIQLQAANGAICTLSLSFNNDGPLGTFFRYICDNDTYIARYDDLVTGKEEPRPAGLTVAVNEGCDFIVIIAADIAAAFHRKRIDRAAALF